MSDKKKVKVSRIIMIILMIIGGITVLDNTYRLGKNIGKAIKNHRWNTVVIHE